MAQSAYQFNSMIVRFMLIKDLPQEMAMLNSGEMTHHVTVVTCSHIDFYLSYLHYESSSVDIWSSPVHHQVL